MNRWTLVLICMISGMLIHCSGPSPEEVEEDKKVDELLKRDQERMDSFKNAMELQSELN